MKSSHTIIYFLLIVFLEATLSAKAEAERCVIVSPRNMSKFSGVSSSGEVFYSLRLSDLQVAGQISLPVDINLSSSPSNSSLGIGPFWALGLSSSIVYLEDRNTLTMQLFGGSPIRLRKNRESQGG